jgi:hypothetical protein
MTAKSRRTSSWVRKVISGGGVQQQRDQGKAHQAAVRALAFKWIRILYRCWQNRTLYDESTYLQALTQRGSLLMHNLAK